MSIQITLANIQAIIPTKPEIIEKFIEPLNVTIIKYDIGTEARLSAFLAQIFHESGNLTAVKENLNYSQRALLTLFKKYFDAETAPKYARNQEMIANRIYANRMGNGDEKSGEAFKYRGRGLIQCTGKNNYKACGDSLKIDLLSKPELLETPKYAALSAGWFWDSNKLNSICDKNTEESFIQLTKRINGGIIGLEHRLELWHKAKLVF